MRVIRDQNGLDGQDFGVFEVNYKIGSEIQVHYILTDATEGQLGLYFDGTNVSFYYKTDGEWEHTGWSDGLTAWNPHWASAPQLYIQGYDEYAITTFSVDNVQYTPVAEASTIFLLASGLIGIAEYGRRKVFKK